MSEKRTYHFIAREVTERYAMVEAPSAAEARALLEAGAVPGGGFDDPRITLDDIESVSMTFRSVRVPEGW